MDGWVCLLLSFCVVSHGRGCCRIDAAAQGPACIARTAAAALPPALRPAWLLVVCAAAP